MSSNSTSLSLSIPSRFALLRILSHISIRHPIKNPMVESPQLHIPRLGLAYEILNRRCPCLQFPLVPLITLEMKAGRSTLDLLLKKYRKIMNVHCMVIYSLPTASDLLHFLGCGFLGSEIFFAATGSAVDWWADVEGGVLKARSAGLRSGD